MNYLNHRIACVSLAFWAIGGGLAVGCGSDDPVVAAGSYTIAITNGANGCEFANYTVGETAEAIPMTITQDGSDVSAGVSGGAGAVLDLILGGHVFTGSVSGNDLSMEIIGTRSASMGNCTYTLNSRVRASLEGDFLSGTIDYATATNGGTDCGALNECHTLQSFNGTRPPQ